MVFKYPKKTAAFYVVAVFLLVADRWLKSLATHGEVFELVGKIFRFDFVKNYYIAFSLPLFGLWLNSFIGLVILSLIAYLVYLLKKPALVEAGFLFLIILGASSNLFDRLKFGFVVDYFDLSYFTIFNLADAMIFLGVVGVMLFQAATRKKPS